MPLHDHASPSVPSRSPTPAIVLALALLGALVAGAWQAIRQLNEVPGTVFTTPDNAYRPAAPSVPSNGRPSALDAGGPGWETLNTPQKLALYPLAERWALMSEVQKRRWLALAQNFHKLPEEEQARLHERMTAWASLSAQQRNQARINFAAAQRLRPEDKRSQWNAYQALSDEEKKRLAATAAKPHGAATSIQPAPPKKLTRVPAATQAPGNLANPPKVPPASGTTARIAAPGGAPQDKPAAPAAPAAPPAAAASSESSGAPAASEAASTPAPAPAGPTENIYIN
ncbi:DUF3106 domain-containing protein [Comamonas granuli]|uniref:DUF3106 domain-containing protein n=1 Tax=Comamonas granuli TaxID=290309 RepID=UPI0005A60A71|nr:DUF3106 domain-containing protein [Comamonas granuli]